MLPKWLKNLARMQGALLIIIQSKVKRCGSVVSFISREINPCIQTHHLLTNQYYKQNILIMHQLINQPGIESNQISLKTAILQKIQSNKKNINRQFIKKSDNYTLSSFGQKKYQLQLLQTIALYQLKEHPGYISFKGWKKIHTQFWGERITIHAQNLWKIMRFINQGQVIMPTGLVYQVINCLITQPTQIRLRNVFNSFLSKNCKKKDLSSYRQLKNYTSFSQIMNGYIQKITKKENNDLKEQANTTNFLVDRLSKVDRQKQRYLTNLRYQSVADQMKKCSFKPELSQYISQVKRQRREKKQKFDNFLISEMKQKEFLREFKARPLDFKIQTPLKVIPGAQKHIHKQQFCEQQRLRLKRYQDRSIPNYI